MEERCLNHSHSCYKQATSFPAFPTSHCHQAHLRPPPAACAPGLLHKGRDGGGEAHVQRHIQLPDVHAFRVWSVGGSGVRHNRPIETIRKHHQRSTTAPSSSAFVATTPSSRPLLSPPSISRRFSARYPALHSQRPPSRSYMVNRQNGVSVHQHHDLQAGSHRCIERNSTFR